MTRNNIRQLRSVSILVFLMICGSVIAGCERRAPVPSGDYIIGYVNKEPVLASELDKVLSHESKRKPNREITPDMKKEQLDLLIDRKLIVQEAINAGLTRDDSFVAMIKTFWEEALVRRFIDRKRKEFDKDIEVTDKDFKDYYSQISKRMTFRVFTGTDRQRTQEMREQMLAGNIAFDGRWRTVGPVTYQDVTSDVLRKAFDAQQGEVLLIEDLPRYYLVYIERREDIPQGAFADLEPELKKRVMAIKENQMFDEWLKEKREKSLINMVPLTGQGE